MLIHCGSQTRSSFWVKPLRVIAALHKVFQCYSFTSHCFRVGETHAQLRSECGSYIVRARSLTKLATSAPDQECDCLANPVANFIDNIILVRIHVDFSTLDCNLFMEDFDQIQLSNQLAHWWSRPELNRRTRSFNPLLYRLSYRTTIPCLFMSLL